MTIRIKPATPADTPIILQLIRELAEFERLLHEVQATEEQLREQLFGARPIAEVVIARIGAEVAGFALFFHNFSTFLAKPGIYLEDLYVRQKFSRPGLRRSTAAALGAHGARARLRSARMVRARLERPCDRLLQKSRCRPDGPVDRASRNR